MNDIFRASILLEAECHFETVPPPFGKQLLENHVVFGLDDDTNKFLKPSKLLNARAKTAGKYLKPSILPARVTRSKPTAPRPSKGPAVVKRS